MTALAVTPLEVVKIRQQTAPPRNRSVRPCPSCGTFVLNNGLMECIVARKSIPLDIAAPSSSRGAGTGGTFSVLRQIFVKEGFAGIYAGLAPTLVMSVPNTVLYFTAYDEIKARWHKKGYDGAWIPLVSGSTARVLASLATAPLELIRTRQAMMGPTGGRGAGMMGDLRNLVKTEGALALFKGLGPTLWRDAPFSAIYWFSIEQFKLQWKARATTEINLTLPQQAGQAFCNGAAAGMIAAACTTPFDVVKTRQQAMGAPAVVQQQAEVMLCHHHGATPAYQTPTTTFGIMRQVFREEGLEGLWRGNATRMIKIAPACAIMISCYELGKVLLE